MEKENLSELINVGLNSAFKTFSEKDEINGIVENFIIEINEKLNGRTAIITEEYIDDDDDLIKRASVKNRDTGKSEYLFMYYFNKENIFPVSFNFFGLTLSKCFDIDDVIELFKKIATEEQFFIKIVRVLKG